MVGNPLFTGENENLSVCALTCLVTYPLSCPRGVNVNVLATDELLVKLDCVFVHFGFQLTLLASLNSCFTCSGSEAERNSI